MNRPVYSSHRWICVLLVIGACPLADGFAQPMQVSAGDARGRISGLQGSYVSVVQRGAEWHFFSNCIGEPVAGLTLSVGASLNEVGPPKTIAPDSLIDDLLTPAGTPDPKRIITRPVVRYSEKEGRYHAVVHVARGYPPADGRVYPAMLVSKTDDPRKGWTYRGQFKGEPEKLFGSPKSSWTSGMAFLLNDAAGETVDHLHPLANRFVFYNEFGAGLRLLYSCDGSEWFFFRDQDKKLVEIQPAAFRGDGPWIFSSSVQTPAGYFMFVSYRWTDRGPAGHRFLRSQDGVEWRQIEEYPQGPKNYSLAYDAGQDLLAIMPTVLGTPPYAKDLYFLKPPR